MLDVGESASIAMFDTFTPATVAPAVSTAVHRTVQPPFKSISTGILIFTLVATRYTVHRVRELPGSNADPLRKNSCRLVIVLNS